MSRRRKAPPRLSLFDCATIVEETRCDLARLSAVLDLQVSKLGERDALRAVLELVDHRICDLAVRLEDAEAGLYARRPARPATPSTPAPPTQEAEDWLRRQLDDLSGKHDDHTGDENDDQPGDEQ